MAQYSQNYAFPNVSVTEDIIGPVSVNPGYRNTIGVAGVFSKGPTGAVFLNSRQEIRDIYGEDSSPGSIFIRTAQQQGATDFVISRVLPSARFSQGLVYLQAGVNPSISEAVTASADNRTVGLKLKLNYIGSPFVSAGVFLGTKVSVDKTSLNIPGFEGAASYDFTVRERIDNATVTPTSVTVTLPTVTTEALTSIRKITVTGTTAAALIAQAKPGEVLTTAEAGITFASASGANLEIISYPKLESTGVYSLLVKGSITGTLAATTVCSIAAYAGTGVYFILSYSSRTPTSDLLPSDFVRNVTYENGIIADGFMVVKAVDTASQSLKLLTKTLAGVYGQVEPNILIAVGDNTQVGATELILNSAFTISFIQANVEVGENDPTTLNFPNTAKAFGYNLSASEILYELQAAISGSSAASRLVNDYTIELNKDTALNTESLPYTLNIKSGFTGLEANRIFLNLTRTVGGGTPQDVLFGANGMYYGTNIAFTNGFDTLKNADLYLYDSLGNPLVWIQSLSAGNAGNNIKVSIKPDIRGQFRLDVFDNNISADGLVGKSETFVLNNFSVDPATGFYTETINSTLIRAFFIPVSKTGSLSGVSSIVLNSTPQRTAPPLSILALSSDLSNALHPSHRGAAYLQNLFLKNGGEPNLGNAPAEADYITAVRALENSDCAFIAVDNLFVTDSLYQGVHAELISQAERSTTSNGLRVAVLACPPRMTKGRVRLIKNGVNSARVIFVAGWTTFSSSLNNGFNNVSPTGHYCGKLSVVAPHISPASISEAGSLNGIISVDHLSNPDYLNELTINGVDAIFYDTGSKSYKILNGRNSNTNTSDYYISIRRQADNLIQDLYVNLQWARSAKNDKSLRDRVASSVDTYLDTQRAEGRISGFVPTVCNGSNNTNLTIPKGELNIRIVWTPVYPADYIKVNIIRDVTAELTLAL